MATLRNTVHEGIAAAVSQSAPAITAFLQFFAMQTALGTRYVNLDKKFSKARVASFVNPSAVADGTEKLHFERVPFLLPTVQDLQSITGVDLEQLGIGEWGNANERQLDRLDNKVMEIHADQRGMVDNRNALSAIEVAFDGKLTVKGKGENRVLDFGRPADLTVDVGAVDNTEYWNNAGANIETHLTDALEIMGGYGMTGDVLIGRHAVVKLIAKNNGLKERIDNRRTEIGGSTYESLLATQGMAYYGDIDGVKLFGFDGNYQKEDGNMGKAVPDKKVVLIASNNNNILQPASSPIINNGDVMFDNTEFATVVRSGGNGRDVIIEAQHTIAPLEVGVGSFMTLTVLA